MASPVVTPVQPATVQVFDAPTIRRVVGVGDLIDSMAEVFADYARHGGEAPITVFAPQGEKGDVHVKSAWMTGRSIYTVKVASWFAARAEAHGVGSSGFIAAHDATTGDLLALLHDEHHLTDIRTAAAGAVVTRRLARPDARTLAVLGTGVQAYLQTLAALEVRDLDSVFVWGRSPARAELLRRVLTAKRPELNVRVSRRAEDAVRAADIVVTATSSREPIVHGSWLQPGAHVTAVGADDVTKAELDPAAYARADILVVDSVTETRRFAGDLQGAVAAGSLTSKDIRTDVGDLLLSRHPGREAADQISIAKLIGLGIQDLAAVETALQRLTADPACTSATEASALDLVRRDA